MTGLGQCRLLRDPPGGGAWNMAVDEVLLERAAAEQLASWRFYAWREPTLSLGYFQSYADRGQHAASGSCPVVRRLTGGGAILHDAELTYSVALPAEHPLAARRERLYGTVHAALVEALGALGIAAGLCQGAGRQPEPFLCFQRRAPGDVLVEGVKIAGSAQRRLRRAVLQHGSLLLRRSPAAPELPGLEDLAGGPLADTLTGRWLDRLTGRLAAGWAVDRLRPDELQRAALLAADRYNAASWTQRQRGRVHSA
ncbi:MAG: lipoate--protein ligase family protein [Thermoguttaceae bacterium]|jgi:lipoate-protein ligase A